MLVYSARIDTIYQGMPKEQLLYFWLLMQILHVPFWVWQESNTSVALIVTVAVNAIVLWIIKKEVELDVNVKNQSRDLGE